jgi:predicted outer membrane lipoprotein
MAKKGIGDFPRVNPTEEVTGKGIAVLLAFIAFYVVLYALSYPLGRLADHALLGVAFADFFSLSFLLLAIVGLLLVVHYRRSLVPGDLVAPLFLAALVWLAIQAQYWYNNWTPSVAYYDPTFHAVETFLITLGSIGLLKTHLVLQFRLAGSDLAAAGRSLGLGVLLGIPFAILNALLYIFVNGKNIVREDVLTEAIMALKPAIMEEMAFRLLFMGLAIVVLSKVLPRHVAIVSAVFMAIVFHSAAHVPGLLATDPVLALASVVVTSLLFGLPMALLAYKKDIETAIGFHWVIDAVRFSLGL